MDKQHIKSQVAMEFMVLAGFLLFVFALILGIVSYNASYVTQKRDILIGEDIVTKVQKEINLAARVLNGYSRNFELPQKLGNKDYTISIESNEVVLRTEKQDFWRRVPSVVGNINKGENSIKKINGTLYLN